MRAHLLQGGKFALPSIFAKVPSLPTRQDIAAAIPTPQQAATGVSNAAKGAALGFGTALAIQSIGQAMQVASQLPEIEGGTKRKSYLKRVLGNLLTPQNLIVAPAIGAAMFHIGNKLHKATGH